MLTIYSEDHALHRGRGEFTDGRLVPCFETPERALMVLDTVRAAGFPVLPPQDHGLDPILAVHDPRLVAFLQDAHAAWRALGREGDALPMAWPMRRLRDVEPAEIDGRLGYWCFDAATPIGSGTWQAAYSSTQVALTGAERLAEEKAAFALCRPPGHHAAQDVYGGYCFLNNAAIAAQALRAGGAGRVAILDIDYHHGNGTQAIFWERPDVLFASVHADPAREFPFFLGYAEERGAGAGEGATLNLPLPPGTGIDAYLDALDRACAMAEGADALVVSLGVDTYAGDPISTFTLKTAEFPALGRRIGRLGLPTLFVMEGGYAVEQIGANVMAVLSGFLEVHP